MLRNTGGSAPAPLLRLPLSVTRVIKSVSKRKIKYGQCVGSAQPRPRSVFVSKQMPPLGCIRTVSKESWVFAGHLIGWQRDEDRFRNIHASATSAGATATSEQPPLYPHLDLDFKPHLTKLQQMCTALVSMGFMAACILFRGPPFWTRVLALVLRPSDWVTLFAALAAGAATGTLFFRERQYQARQVPPRQAADADSQFQDVEGLRVHFKRRRGKADSPSPSTTVPWAAALWHGFGANTYSWEMASLDRIADALGPDSLVITHDAAGFGLTERPSGLKKYQVTHNAKVGRTLLDGEMADAQKQSSGQHPVAQWDAQRQSSGQHPVAQWDAQRQSSGQHPVAQWDAQRQSSGQHPVAQWDAQRQSSGLQPVTQWNRLFVGHSLGGWAAAIAATQCSSEARPAALILVAPAFMPSSNLPSKDLKWIDDLSECNCNAPNRVANRFFLTSLRLGAQLAFALLWKVLIGPVVLQVLRLQVRSKKFWKKGLSAAWFNKNGLKDNNIDGYRRPSKVEKWDVGMLRFVEANFGFESLQDFVSKFKEGLFPPPTKPSLTDELKAMAKSGVPILIVHGKQDFLVPLSNSVKLAKVLGADLAILDKCGHLPMEECPNEFMAVVESFIQKCTNA